MEYSSLKNQALFWDINLETLDKNVHINFIISRITESGTMEDVKWLLANYTKEEIKNIIKSTRLISEKTANYWRNALDIKEEILCLSDQYQKTQKMLWTK